MTIRITRIAICGLLAICMLAVGAMSLAAQSGGLPKNQSDQQIVSGPANAEPAQALKDLDAIAREIVEVGKALTAAAMSGDAKAQGEKAKAQKTLEINLDLKIEEAVLYVPEVIAQVIGEDPALKQARAMYDAAVRAETAVRRSDVSDAIHAPLDDARVRAYGAWYQASREARTRYRERLIQTAAGDRPAEQFTETKVEQPDMRQRPDVFNTTEKGEPPKKAEPQKPVKPTKQAARPQTTKKTSSTQQRPRTASTTTPRPRTASAPRPRSAQTFPSRPLGRSEEGGGGY